MNNVGWPRDGTAPGAQPLDERPAERPTFEAVPPANCLSERSLARRDGADDRPRLALADGPTQVAEHHCAAGPHDGGVVEEEQAVVGRGGDLRHGSCRKLWRLSRHGTVLVARS